MTALETTVLTATELEAARSRIAALEQLLDVFERSSLEQHDKVGAALERERKARAEAEAVRCALEESENRLRLALAAGRMGTWEWDIEHHRFLWSSELQTLYGMERGELAGTVEDYAARIHPEDREAAMSLARQNMAARAPTHHATHRIVTPAGQVRWLDSHGRFFYADDGRPLRLAGVSTDVTDRRAVEAARDAALAAAERAGDDLQRVFMQAPAAIAATQGPQHVFHTVNPRYSALVGNRKLIGRPIREVFLEQDVKPLIDLLDQVYRSGEPFVGNEVRALIDRSGTGRLDEGFYNFVYQPLFSAEGRVAGIMIHAVDVTELVRNRRAVEQQAEELRRLATALERSNRDLDQFAYVASHDLKAPLRGISNLASWIEEDVGEQLSGTSREHLTLLRGRVSRMEALIDGVLAYSRAGRVRSTMTDVATGDVVREVLDLLSPPPKVHVDVAQDMPVIQGDRTEVQQVFLNLIGNALRHGSAEQPRITVRWRAAGAMAEFAVADNGRGIDPAYHDRIWAIFQTLESRDKVESTGIGLSVVKKIVESAGGSVRVESAPGQGATFYFTWPTLNPNAAMPENTMEAVGGTQ